jgi:uncharacterized protein
MNILADTNAIIALLDHSDKYHTSIVQIVENNEILIPATILPEVDYLVNKYLGERVARSFLEALVDGSFQYLPVEIIDIDRAIKIMARYQDIPLGLVDCSLVALAERYQINQILTLDRRHFNIVRPEGVKYFELLPHIFN